MCRILPCPRTYFHERIRCRLDSAPTKQFAALHKSESGTYTFPWPLGGGGGQERSRQLLVEAEKVFHPLPLAREGLGAVAQIHRPVQFRKGFNQRRRHQERVTPTRCPPSLLPSSHLRTGRSGPHAPDPGRALDPPRPRAILLPLSAPFSMKTHRNCIHQSTHPRSGVPEALMH